MGNNRPHALILVHIRKNILNNINLPVLQLNLLIKKTHHNICKITLTLRYFSSVYIPYQMYKIRSCVTFYHSFPQGNGNRISTPENDLIWKVIQGLYGFILNWTFLNFLDFYKKTLLKIKRFTKIVLTNKENPEHI